MTKQDISMHDGRQRSFLLVFPLLAIPFLFGGFYALGGGQGRAHDPVKTAAGMGFNMELPKPKFDPKENKMNKLDFYKKAEADSIRKRGYQRLDPYLVRTATTPAPPTTGIGLPHPPVRMAPLKDAPPPQDPKADELLKKLEGFKKSLAHSEDLRRTAVDHPGIARFAKAGPEPELPVRSIPRLPVDTPARDPQLDRINEMLDKIIRIQHPAPDSTGEKEPGRLAALDTVHDRGRRAEELSSNTLPAIVQGNQKLVAGATIALRLTEEVLIDSIRMPRDQLLYGTVSIHNDRMGVHINSIRNGLILYTVSIEVYDMDGQPGIHIKDMSLRQVTKESADMGVGSLNVLGYDPTIGGQAANAGFQAVKSLFRKKVRPMRVPVKNGYTVLLRDTRSGRHAGDFRVIELPDGTFLNAN
ncbi:MAG TPA: conjugative transposon protein TraM [Puia sp.]|jgi:hypothetical protein